MGNLTRKGQTEPKKQPGVASALPYGPAPRAHKAWEAELLEKANETCSMKMQKLTWTTLSYHGVATESYRRRHGALEFGALLAGFNRARARLGHRSHHVSPGAAPEPEQKSALNGKLPPSVGRI